MHYLVVSKKHGLFALAHWLRQEGQSVTCTSLKIPYARRAWRGIATLERGRGFNQPLKEWLTAIKPEETTLITDCAYLTHEAQEMPFAAILGSGAVPRTATQSPIRVGAWWKHDSTDVEFHWVFLERGLGPGGTGPQLEAAWTLVQPFHPIHSYVPVTLFTRQDEHRALLEKWHGYAQIDVMWDEEEKGWRTGSLRLGWCPQALTVLQSQEKIMPVFETGKALLAPFTVGLPVWVPPYPYTASRLQPVQLAAVPQIPMDVAQGARGLESGVLDGMLGICTGRGKTFEHARSYSLSNAQSLQAAQATWRLDVGQQVPAALSRLETLGWY